MSDETFILILKSKYKKYFENGKSVGMEVQELVAMFRQEIEDEILKFKYKEITKNRKHDHYKNENSTAR